MFSPLACAFLLSSSVKNQLKCIFTLFFKLLVLYIFYGVIHGMLSYLIYPSYNKGVRGVFRPKLHRRIIFDYVGPKVDESFSVPRETHTSEVVSPGTIHEAGKILSVLSSPLCLPRWLCLAFDADRTDALA